jgi:acyl transferase domain-containing protein
LAQPLCTAFQLALCNKFAALGLKPKAVVGLAAAELAVFLCDGAVVACENSPNSSTISGDALAISEVTERIKREMPEVLVRLLKVDVAYHSRKHPQDHALTNTACLPNLPLTKIYKTIWPR